MNKFGLTVVAAVCLFVATPPADTTQAAKAKPPKPKNLLKEVRAAVQWMDKNPDVVSEWMEARQMQYDSSSHFGARFKKRHMFVGRFLIRLNPKNLSNPRGFPQRPPFHVTYRIANPVRKPIRYYSTQREREKLLEDIRRSPADTASIRKEANRDPEMAKKYRETFELIVTFEGSHIDDSKVRRLRRQTGTVVCTVTEVEMENVTDYDDKSFDKINKPYIRRIKMNVVEQR